MGPDSIAQVHRRGGIKILHQLPVEVNGNTIAVQNRRGFVQIKADAERIEKVRLLGKLWRQEVGSYSPSYSVIACVEERKTHALSPFRRHGDFNSEIEISYDKVKGSRIGTIKGEAVVRLWRGLEG